MAKDTKLNNLVINYLTQEQYDAIESPNENELYLTPDKTDQTYGKLAGNNIWTGINSFTDTTLTDAINIYTGYDANTEHELNIYISKIGETPAPIVKIPPITSYSSAVTTGICVTGILPMPNADGVLENRGFTPVATDFLSLVCGDKTPEQFTGLFLEPSLTYSEPEGTSFLGLINDKKYGEEENPPRILIALNSEGPHITWNLDNSTQYNFTFPMKSGTFALTSDIKETHHHTITIKEGTKIIFAANRELESATAATNLETLISTFAGTTTAGFGDYILLTVDTAAKLKKQDGTEVDLSTLTFQILDWVK